MPDYRLSILEIYREFKLRCLHDDPDLFILSVVEDCSLRRITDLPSWVPYFSVPLIRSPLLYPDLDVMVPYTASGESKLHVTWSEANPDCVILQGHQVDVIRGVLAIESSAQLSDIIQHTTTLTRDFPSKYCTGELKTDDIWRTLTANVANTPAYKYPAPELFSEFFAQYHNEGTIVDDAHLGHLQLRDETDYGGHQLAHLPADSSPPRDCSQRQGHDDQSSYASDLTKLSVTSEDHSTIDSTSANETDDHGGSQARYGPQDFQAAVSRVMRERKFFTTEHKRYGIGPQSIQEGDLVFLFAGGRIPYILRPRESIGKTSFNFVGECYCHGLCEGQAFSESRVIWQGVQLE
jgi:hypothetical protein